MTVEPGNSIRRLGFRRWYERQLFESFAWLATCLLSGVAFAAMLEFVGLGGGNSALVTLIVLYFIGLIGFTAWRTFWRSLERAQRYADRATCAGCAAYGLFDVTRDAEPIRVRCRKCGHDWSLGGRPPAG